MEPGMKADQRNVNNNLDDANKSDRRKISIDALPPPPEDWLQRETSFKPAEGDHPQLPNLQRDDDQVLHFLKAGAKPEHERSRDCSGFDQPDIRSKPEMSRTGAISECGDGHPMMLKSTNDQKKAPIQLEGQKQNFFEL